MDEPLEQDAPPDSTNHGPLDVSVRSTTAAAALAAINNGVPVPNKSKARATKKLAPANVLEDNALLPQPASAAVPTPRPQRGHNQNQEQLPRQSKILAKQAPATPAPKGKKRQAEQSDKTGGNKRAKKGESSATGRDPNEAKANTNEPDRGFDLGKEEDGEDWLIAPPLSYSSQEPLYMLPQFDRPKLDKELELNPLAEDDNTEDAYPSSCIGRNLYI
ncbi:hypothetical protein RhiLY_07830 [Ceratobasidium sp. AG-Ba]|nr:hypothetical protein RhiLY_07830 [Ceratobasidium sp. AG-Ba]